MDKEVEEVLGIQQGGRREVGKGVQVVIMMRVLLPHATSGTRKVLKWCTKTLLLVPHILFVPHVPLILLLYLVPFIPYKDRCVLFY